MATKNDRVSSKGAKPVGDPDKGMPRDTPEGPTVKDAQPGVKPVGEADKNAAQRTGPELPVVEPIDGSDYDGKDGVAHDNAEPKKATAKPVPGTVTYKAPDGALVTNEVDDIHNPPEVLFDDAGKGEVVDRAAKE